MRDNLQSKATRTKLIVVVKVGFHRRLQVFAPPSAESFNEGGFSPVCRGRSFEQAVWKKTNFPFFIDQFAFEYLIGVREEGGRESEERSQYWARWSRSP